MMTTQHAIHAQGLKRSSSDLEVLRGVDLDGARGSIVALLGSNGAGKTTVVKAAPAPSEEAVEIRARAGHGDITNQRSLEAQDAADL
ncbi:uncharacterized protein SOCEGT47_049390 [Sorangium cellulosum]|uniref:ABC transporter domain-containing protein n=1 Tax=Sorangium cellulosum TaxID=56 RepID=A0A4V0NDZ6_SORCE|nr:ATP-binding cassette domain-containing protein [Sorangium cellulosum]AUX24402.1 uncharacterized protein SOCEGT47_049390 [Sorangium cellulosum]